MFLKSKCNWISPIHQSQISKYGIILLLLLFTTIFNVVAPMISGKNHGPELNTTHNSQSRRAFLLVYYGWCAPCCSCDNKNTKNPHNYGEVPAGVFPKCREKLPALIFSTSISVYQQRAEDALINWWHESLQKEERLSWHWDLYLLAQYCSCQVIQSLATAPYLQPVSPEAAPMVFEDKQGKNTLCIKYIWYGHWGEVWVGRQMGSPSAKPML